MGTPAKNISYAPYLIHYQHRLKRISDGHLYPVDSSLDLAGSWYLDHRPASTGMPWTGSPKFRLPTPWYHENLNIKWSCPGPVEINNGNPSYNQYYDGQAGSWQSGPLCPLATPSFSNNLVNRAEAEALNKLKNQNLHLGNFAATFHENVSMISKHARSIAKQVNKFKNKFPSLWEKVKIYEPSRRRDWCLIPNAWLELQYGWRPLMQDVMGGLAAIQQGARDEGLMVNVVRTVKDHGILEKLWDGYSSAQCAVDIHYSELAKVSLWYRLRDPGLAELSSLGLIDPAEIVWEVLKYSFVVDWFLPIGNWLSSLTADVGFDFISGTLSQVWEAGEVDIGAPYFTSSGYTFVSSNVPKVDLKYKNFVRTVYTSPPVPGIYVKNPLSTGHLLNALALLVQAFK